MQDRDPFLPIDGPRSECYRAADGRYIAGVRPIYGEGKLASELTTARRLRQSGEEGPLHTVVLQSASVRSQGERAYLLIRDQIVTLKLAPGSVIAEAGLRQELGLGRTPIREALQRLAHENLVTFVPHRGTFVSDINLTESDVYSLMRLDQRIHRLVYQATRNAFLQAMLEESFNLSLRIWFLGLDRGVRLKEAVEEHRQLLDAIVSRDAQKAESVMRQHVAGFEHAIRKVL